MTATLSRRLVPVLVLASALTLCAAPLRAAEPTSLPEAQAQLREAVAQALKARMEKAAPAKRASSDAGRAAKLSCHDKTRAAEGYSGTLDLGSLRLETTRSAAVSAVKETDESKVVDGRCGRLPAALSESLTFEVTAPGYWGQDFLQLPKSAAQADGKPFEARLHSCSYDGDYHSDSDAVLVCTLSR